MTTTGAGPWWKEGIVYQIYPRSFADADGDGDGDLRGIIQHLDHLNDGTDLSLGIDAIWLSPIYPSPKKDAGYDVSDYCAIDPGFGTMADFDELLREAHRRGIRVILDLVLNHCSSEHPWFVEARRSRDAPRRNWFVWADGAGAAPRRPPNNWLGMFGGSAWEWDAGSRQYYLHSFLAEQPDFDWRNPEVKRAMGDVMRFWLDRGVDGFRLDVVNWFVKDAALRDNPRRWWGLRPYDRQIHLYDRNRPETIDVTREIRALVDSYPERMTVGEVYAEPPGDPALAARFCAEGAGLHLAFNFAFLHCPWSAEAFANAVERWEKAVGPAVWPTYTLSNHDQTRAFTRYRVRGRGESEARARVAAAMLLTLRGTPFLYYGEEIGMDCRRVPRAKLRDPIGIRYWPVHPGRDVARTPMQWSPEPQAGFTRGQPWLPVQSDHAAVNVALQQGRPESLFAWYRDLIRVRRSAPALRRGSYRRLPQPSKSVFGYAREDDGEAAVVLLNFHGRRARAALPTGSWTRLLSSDRSRGAAIAGGAIDLAPYEALLASRVET